MTKLVEIVRMFILSMVVAVMMIPATGYADYYTVPVTQLNKFVGTWYDVNGNVALTIGSDYSINGCKVLSFSLNNNYQPICCFYSCRTNEGNRVRDISLDATTTASYNDYHQMIILNGQNGLRRSKNPKYFESIGGIYIGMGKNEVLRLYGQPSRISNGYGWTKAWHYNQENFDVNFAGDTVISISIYKNGNRRFDRTGLSANDSYNTFKYNYNARDILRHSLDIGHGEMITFYNNYVTLEIVRES